MIVMMGVWQSCTPSLCLCPVGWITFCL